VFQNEPRFKLERVSVPTLAFRLHRSSAGESVRILTVLLVVVSAAADDPAPRLYTEIPAIAHGEAVIWHDPGAIEKLDFRYGIGGEAMTPKPPFSFVKENMTGTSPKVTVKDANQRTWVIKFGAEASPDTFSTRLVWAVGYWAEPNYFVADGTIQGVHNLARVGRYVDKHGNFHGGRFQLRSSTPEYLDNINWKWDGNPFVGKPELNGLKIMMMLVSNWDDKDYRDADVRGSNTAIYKDGERYIFFIDDWGASLGNWGKVFKRSKWNCADYYRQSKGFVKSLKNGAIDWGYIGQHTHIITDGIRVSDVKWLTQYLGRVTDEQLRTGLISSGASEEDVGSCTQGIRTRITELQTVANSAGLSAAQAN
jgi:hypothetical protein